MFWGVEANEVHLWCVWRGCAHWAWMSDGVVLEERVCAMDGGEGEWGETIGGAYRQKMADLVHVWERWMGRIRMKWGSGSGRRGRTIVA
jgi:hypothetical protein